MVQWLGGREVAERLGPEAWEGDDASEGWGQCPRWGGTKPMGGVCSSTLGTASCSGTLHHTLPTPGGATKPRL